MSKIGQWLNVLFFSLPLIGISQVRNPGLHPNPELADEEIFTAVEQNPEFYGGPNTMYEYIKQNLIYPDEAKKNHIEGRVFVRFVVNKTGKLSDFAVLKGIGFGCDEEAVRVLYSMPDWQPGFQNEKPVNVSFTIPIFFSIQDDSVIESVNYVPYLVRIDELFPNKEPLLYIVDGYSMNRFEKIDRNKIKSSKILEPNLAESKYGYKARNGAVEIELTP